MDKDDLKSIMEYQYLKKKNDHYNSYHSHLGWCCCN